MKRYDVSLKAKFRKAGIPLAREVETRATWKLVGEGVHIYQQYGDVIIDLNGYMTKQEALDIINNGKASNSYYDGCYTIQGEEKGAE